MSRKPSPSARAAQDNADTDWLLKQKQFRRWFLRVMETSGIGYDTFQPEPLTLAYRAGRVSLGTEALQTLLNADPRARLLLEEERLAQAMETESGPRERNPDDTGTDAEL